MKRSRRLAFVVIAFSTAVSLLAVAQPKKPAPKPAPAAAAKKPGARPEEAREGGAPLAAREERATPASSKDAGTGGAVLESRTVGDGGARVFRFGEVEVEGRLKSPQIVYFLRRVRAEFAAGDLGHRSFLREMSETRNEKEF